MRSIPTPGRRQKRLLAIALVGAALLVAGSIAPAFGAPNPARALKLAQQALRLAKRADVNSGHALNVVRRPGPTGPQGPRGSEGLDGPQGTDGEDGPRGPTGPTGPQGVAGANGTNGTNGAPGATGPQGPPGYARAFATVKPDGTIVAARSAGITGATRPSDDQFCISAAAVDASQTSPIVSVDLGLSTGAPSSLFVTVDSTGGACPAGDIAVVTAGPAANSVAFTILIP